MQELQQNVLWSDAQPLSVATLPLGRRVTVARGAAEQLIVFSPLRADERVVAELTKLGSISAFIVPSRFHIRFYEQYFERFRGARFYAGPRVIKDHPKWPLTELNRQMSDLDGFDFEYIEGMPKVAEVAFFHKRSRSLIVADAIFNVPATGGLWSRLMMKMAGIGGAPAPSRLFKSMIKDEKSFAQSLRTIGRWDFDRIIGGHGEIISSDAKSAFFRAFSGYFA